METVTHALLRHSAGQPDKVALSDGRVRLTWEDVNKWTNQAAGWFMDLCLPRGSVVLGWLPNCAEWYLLRLACERAGFFWIPIPTSHGKRELTSIVARTRPSVLVTVGEFREKNYTTEMTEVCEAAGLTPVRLQVSMNALLQLRGSSMAGSEHELRLDEPAHALSTTGSEGIPKLAIYTLAAACTRAHAQASLLRLTVDDAFLVLSPGTGPARAAWLAAPIAGSRVIGLPIFGVAATLALIAQERPSIVCGTPAQLAMLVPKLDQIDTSSVRIWYTAGSVLPPALAEDLERLTEGIVISTYGGSDFGGWASPAPDDPPEIRYHTVGRPRGGTEFRIVNADGQDLPHGEVGELIGRGPCCVSGFLGESGTKAWRNGWFHTGDLASLDTDNNVVISGRLKEIIVRGGDKISPVEIESILRKCPAVSQVAIIGISDQILEERICACVVPKIKTDPPDLESIRGYMISRGIAKYKLPEKLLILESLPLVGDKVNRKALLELLVPRR